MTHFEHAQAVWGDNANYMIVVLVRDEAGDVTEQLWAEQHADNHFRVCSIPAFARNLALGDIVQVDPACNVMRVIAPSGRSTFRIWSESGWLDKVDILHEIARLGGLMEECTFGLTSIDAQDAASTWKIWDYLVEMQNQGKLDYETGHWAAGDIRK